MSNRIFEELLIEKVLNFKNTFSVVAPEIFVNPDSGLLCHPGEYGTYREAACKEFLKLITPQSLSINQGFLINTEDEVSTQCDIIIYDEKATPIIESNERQRFFPVETVSAVGEVKSTLSKEQFKDGLNKLAKAKGLKKQTENPSFVKRFRNMTDVFNPAIIPYDAIFSFLICHRLDFKLGNIVNEFNDLYDERIPKWQRHNLILSIEDGIFLYQQGNESYDMMYPAAHGIQFKNTFIIPIKEDPYQHFKRFATYLFMGTSSSTIVMPEISGYIVNPIRSNDTFREKS